MLIVFTCSGIDGLLVWRFLILFVDVLVVVCGYL